MVYEIMDDTYLMNDALRIYNQRYKLLNKKVLEVGAGNGFNSVFCLQEGANVYSLDIDNSALDHIEKLDSKINLIHSDMFTSLKEKDFDLIFFNPPYLPSDDFKHIDLDGGYQGMHFIDLFLDKFDIYLKKGAHSLLLFSSLNNLKKIEKKITDKNFKFEVLVSKSFFFEKLFVILIY